MSHYKDRLAGHQRYNEVPTVPTRSEKCEGLQDIEYSLAVNQKSSRGIVTLDLLPEPLNVILH